MVPITTFNLNGVNTHLAMERELDKCGKKKWCLFQKAATHSNKECQIQLVTKINNVDTKCAIISRNPSVLGAREPHPRCDPNRSSISFIPAKVPTEEDTLWLFGGPMKQPVESFGGVTDEGTGGLAFITEQN